MTVESSFQAAYTKLPAPEQEVFDKLLKRVLNEVSAHVRPLTSILRNLSFMPDTEIEFCIDAYSDACTARAEAQAKNADAGGEQDLETYKKMLEKDAQKPVAQDDKNAGDAAWNGDWNKGWEWNSSNQTWDGYDWKDDWSWAQGWEGDSGKDKGSGKGEGKAGGKEKKGDSKSVKGKGSGKGSAGKKLYLGNLPADITEEDLQAIFGEHGAIIDLHVMQGRSKRTGQSCAMLVYATADSTEACRIHAEKGWEVREGEGSIVVKYADDQEVPSGPRAPPRARDRGKGWK